MRCALLFCTKPFCIGTICTKPATLLKVTLLHGCFSRLLNCTNGTKSRNTSVKQEILIN